jgi:hypothetical protein
VIAHALLPRTGRLRRRLRLAGLRGWGGVTMSGFPLAGVLMLGPVGVTMIPLLAVMDVRRSARSRLRRVMFGGVACVRARARGAFILS